MPEGIATVVFPESHVTDPRSSHTRRAGVRNPARTRFVIALAEVKSRPGEDRSGGGEPPEAHGTRLLEYTSSMVATPEIRQIRHCVQNFSARGSGFPTLPPRPKPRASARAVVRHTVSTNPNAFQSCIRSSKLPRGAREDSGIHLHHDGSTDGAPTASMPLPGKTASDGRSFRRNYGKSAALDAAFRLARAPSSSHSMRPPDDRRKSPVFSPSSRRATTW